MNPDLQSSDAPRTRRVDCPQTGFATICDCGTPLVQPATGRRRPTCSEACRRRRDLASRRRRRAQRDVARCQDWLQEWLALGRAERVSARELAEQVGALLADLEELRALL